MSSGFAGWYGFFTPLESPTIYGGVKTIIVKFLIERATFKATSFLTGFTLRATLSFFVRKMRVIRAVRIFEDNDGFSGLPYCDLYVFLL